MLEKQLIFEILGYAASFMGVLSIMMRSILRLRIISLISGILFIIYGFSINAMPVAIVSSINTSINAVFLCQIVFSREYFTLLEFSQDSNYLHYFLKHYKKDIRKLYPNFKNADFSTNHFGFYILRNMVPAGIFIAEKNKDGTCNVKLDYVIKSYRDFKVGKFIFRNNKQFFRKKNIKKVLADGRTMQYRKYLRRMGFQKPKSQSFEFKIA
ncbi:MAG: hypothetical protein MJB14_05445 [Spirochaetes bacterium]|nr:hypothetical protein [Spirochaetota bacterium]